MRDERKTPAKLKKFIKREGKTKLKPLRKTVLHPLLITVTALSIIMLIFFNIVISIMLYSGVCSDLNSISGTIKQLYLKEDSSEANQNEIINLYNNEIDRRSVSYYSNMVIFSKDGEILKSAVPFQGYEKDTLKSLYNEIKKADKLLTHKAEDDVYTLIKIDILMENGESAIVFASLRSLWGTLKWSNRALLVIIGFAVLGFILASYIISKNISTPIKELSDQMELIGDGDFTPVKTTETSTELNTLTLSINEMLARLEAYNDAHTKSIQNLSHDLRTPLMSIGGYAEGIKYGVLENTDEACDVIIKESKQLTEIVEKILILSELDALHQPINSVPQNLSEFLNKEIKSLDGYALKNHIDVITDYELESEEVLADAHLLKTIVENLISNGIRYAKKELVIKTFVMDDMVHLAVCDDGNGLSDEDLEHLFVRYYVGNTGHSGLGLSTAKSAAEYMGCKLSGVNRNSLPKDHPCYNKNGAVFTLVFSNC